MVAVLYIVIQLVEGNVLVPLVMRNTIGLSPFLVIVSLLLGSAVAGLVGALVAVPIAASIEVILERMQAREVPVAPDPSAGEQRRPSPTREPDRHRRAPRQHRAEPRLTPPCKVVGRRRCPETGRHAGHSQRRRDTRRNPRERRSL